MGEFSSCVKCERETNVLDARFGTVCGGEMLNSQRPDRAALQALVAGHPGVFRLPFLIPWH